MKTAIAAFWTTLLACGCASAQRANDAATLMRIAECIDLSVFHGTRSLDVTPIAFAQANGDRNALAVCNVTQVCAARNGDQMTLLVRVFVAGSNGRQAIIVRPTDLEARTAINANTILLQWGRTLDQLAVDALTVRIRPRIVYATISLEHGLAQLVDGSLSFEMPYWTDLLEIGPLFTIGFHGEAIERLPTGNPQICQTHVALLAPTSWPRETRE